MLEVLEVHYFASVREALDRDKDQVPWSGEVATVADLVQLLSAQDAVFKALNESDNPLLVAVNQTVVDKTYPLSSGDEVAFFPPMTGG